jgi:hypothetical protein
MMRNIALRTGIAALAGMVVLAVWGMVFWGLLADPLGVFHKIPNDTDVTKMLLAGNVSTGTYFMPWPRNTPETFESFVAQHQAGPFYRLSYVREGVNPNSVGKILLGCLHYLIVAMIAVVLVMLIGNYSFARRFAVVVLGGLLGSIFITAGDPIWFHLPWDYAGAVFLNELIAWLLLGAVIAKLAPAIGLGTKL